MNILVIGLGSMGKRRIRLMQQLDSSLKICGIDSNTERCQDVAQQFHIECFPSIDSAFQSGEFDCAFVCTSPLSHSGIIMNLLDQEIHIFTEINLVTDQYEDIIEKARKKKKHVFLSSTFLYRNDIRYIINRVADERVNYIYHSGQYLPDWHPWENYQNFFVKDKRSNGCREILAIELPWLIRCFGKIKNIQYVKDKMSHLKLDYSDNYLLLIEHENGNKGMFAVDIVSRKPRRNLEIYGEDIQIFWDGNPKSLEEFCVDTKEMKTISTYSVIDKDKNYCDNIIENAYMEEIITFFNLIAGKSDTKVMHDFQNDLEILRIIDLIEGDKYDISDKG